MSSDVFQGYDGVIWDYDGVILDSDEIREFGFVECLKTFPSHQVDQLLAFHRENGGLSRFVKFRHFFEVIREEKLTEERLSQLCLKFSSIMRQKLESKSLLMQCAIRQIQHNYQMGRPQFIASGSAQDELRVLCKAQDIDTYFDGIFGSPTHKNDIVAAIIKERLDLNAWCLIGDSINDFHAAEKSNIAFIGVRNESLKNRGLSYLEGWE